MGIINKALKTSQNSGFSGLRSYYDNKRKTIKIVLNGQLRFYDMSEPKPARPADGEAEGAGDGALTDGNIAACHP